MFKHIITGLVTLSLLAISVQLYHLYVQNRGLASDVAGLRAESKSMLDENRKLQADLEYFSNPDNYEKAVREQGNYKKPGEKLIIIVPEAGKAE